MISIWNSDNIPDNLQETSCINTSVVTVVAISDLMEYQCILFCIVITVEELQLAGLVCYVLWFQYEFKCMRISLKMGHF